MKEDFGFGDPADRAIGSWPREEHLPGFHDFAKDIYQVCSLVKRTSLIRLT